MAKHHPDSVPCHVIINELTTILSKKIRNYQEIFGKLSDRPVLLVLIGFSPYALTAAGFEVLDKDFGTDYWELRDKRRDAVRGIVEVGDRRNQVCTYDFYQIVGPDVFSAFFEIRFVQNGVFSGQFPTVLSFGTAEDDLVNYYLSFEPDSEQEQRLGTLLSEFEEVYADIMKIGTEVLVGYKSLPEVRDLVPEPSPIVFEEPSNKTLIAQAYEFNGDEEGFFKVLHQALNTESEPPMVVADQSTLETSVGLRLRRLQTCLPVDRKVLLIGKANYEEIHEQFPGVDDILRRYWGNSNFRDFNVYIDVMSGQPKATTRPVSQKLVIEHIIANSLAAVKEGIFRDVFVTAPTGTGKSLMFQIPAIYLAERHNLVTIVVSPLIGLMNDQVHSLKLKDVGLAATINSDISPADKDAIREDIATGQKSLLYLSPETLLSRQDISYLIGDRRIGLVVIDEAHIVTTWGKAFRADYWYLGTYLQRLRKESQFVVATFTATAIYGGVEDMYVETRDSLGLINPITFLGYVRRDNIETAIETTSEYSTGNNEYYLAKFSVMLDRLVRFRSVSKKTLVYFPTVRTILQFVEYVSIHDAKLMDQIGTYYGSLDKLNKRENFELFRSGEKNIMLATKAFGMGIDIPDIAVVYHYAPTGNVCDYIQEIGRAARELVSGHACIDFFKPDFNYVKQLHGISTLRDRQLTQVINKVVEIGKQKDRARNFLVNADEFYHIFTGSRDADEVDNKVKTALLILEKGFLSQQNYSPLIARPRSLYTREFFASSRFDELPSKLKKASELVDSNLAGNKVYRANLKKIWNEIGRKTSFAQFKFEYHEKPESIFGAPLKNYRTLVRISVAPTNEESFLGQIESLVNGLNTVLGRFARTNRHFLSAEFAEAMEETGQFSRQFSRSLADSILQNAIGFCRNMSKARLSYRWFIRSIGDGDTYQIQSNAYSDYSSAILHAARKIVAAPRQSGGDRAIYIERNDRTMIVQWYLILGVLEDFHLCVYRSMGGDNPEIAIRINSYFQLERIKNEPGRYRNPILENVRLRHRTSVAMLNYLFDHKSETEDFWTTVEEYFLGVLPQPVKDEVFGNEAR